MKKTLNYEQKKEAEFWGGNERMTLRNFSVQLTHFTGERTATQGGGLDSFLVENWL